MGLAIGKKQYALGELADYLSAKVKGDSSLNVFGLAPIEAAGQGQITFLANEKYRPYLIETKASAVIVSEADAKDCPVNALVMDNPYLGFARVAQLFAAEARPMAGVHPSAVVGEGVTIGNDVCVGPNTVLADGVSLGDGVTIGAGTVVGKGSRIGSHSTLNANVTVYRGVKIGERCLVHSGAILGADGFGFAKDGDEWVKIPQAGGLNIGDDVEIGSNTTIDRGAMQDTVIGNGVKLDNQIQIGHNVVIGDGTAIAGRSGVAGSTKIGKYCMIGAACGIRGHLEIADRVNLTASSNLGESIKTPGATYSSFIPAQPHNIWLRNMVRIHSLNELAKRLFKLEKRFNSTVDK